MKLNESQLRQIIKEEIQKIIKEGNAFGMAVKKAKEAGKSEFVVNGKTYQVKNNKQESKLGGWGTPVTSGQKVTQEGGWGKKVETKK